MKRMLLALLIPFSAHAKLNVVATTPELAAIAQEIGGDRAEILSLAKPTEDPHFVTPKTSFIVKLNRADALVEGGAELEAGWLTPLLDVARNPKLKRVPIAPAVKLLEAPTSLDRSKGDVHSMGNPHFMTDPLNGRLDAEQIAAAFRALAPRDAGAFAANLAKFNQRLDTKLADWQKRLAPHAGTRLAAYHNTWPYFAQRFGLKIDLFLEPKPGIPPSPGHLAEVIATMKGGTVRVIIVEPYQNHRAAETVATQTGARVVDMAQYPSGNDYVAFIGQLVEKVGGALEGKP